MQSLRILDSYELIPTHVPVAAASIHGEGHIEEPAEADVGAVVALSQLPDDASELQEVRVLRREHRVSLEEGDDALEEVLALARDEDECSITCAVRPDAAAAQSLLNQLEHLSPVTVLADMKLRDELKSDATRRVALHRDREASFSSTYPAI